MHSLPRRPLLWSIALVGALAILIGLVEGHTHRHLDFSKLDAEPQLLSLYKAATDCGFPSETKLNFSSSRDLQMDRYTCTTSQLPKEIINNFADIQEDQSAEVVLFVRQGWFSRKVLAADFTSFHFSQLVAGRIDGHPAVLIESAGQGSGSFTSWGIATAVGADKVNILYPPENEHLRNTHIHRGEIVKSPHPTLALAAEALFVDSDIEKPSDSNCCPTGGVLRSRYSINNGTLRILYTKRLSEHEAKATRESDQHVTTAQVSSTPNSNLTNAGVFSDAPIAINIGVPCPDASGGDLPGSSQRRDMPALRSCDYVFLFKEIVGTKVRALPFLYRGEHPPAIPQELCQVLYSGEVFLPDKGSSYNINFALNNATKMPKIEAIEEVSDEAKRNFLAGINPKELAMLQAQGLRFYKKSEPPRRWY